MENFSEMSPTATLLSICSKKQEFEKMDGLMNIKEYIQTGDFEKDFRNNLNIPKSNINVINFIFNEMIGNILKPETFCSI